MTLYEEYIFGRDDDEYFGSGENGLLVVQDLQDETASLDEQSENGSEIKILQPSELEEKLMQVLEPKI